MIEHKPVSRFILPAPCPRVVVAVVGAKVVAAACPRTLPDMDVPRSVIKSSTSPKSVSKASSVTVSVTDNKSDKVELTVS